MPLTRICITMRITNAERYDEPRDSISHDWAYKLMSWGMTPMPVPNIGAAATDYLDALSPALLILSGGEDIGVSPVRDETEIALLEHAVTTRLPVLGVCRGLQLINTFFGGTLATVDGHVARPHAVTICTAWAPYYGPATEVNSYHNTCIPPAGLAGALQPTAVDTDGLVEAVQHDTLPISAVMWHPERQGAPTGDRALVNALCNLETGA